MNEDETNQNSSSSKQNVSLKTLQGLEAPQTTANRRRVRTGCITCKKRHVKCDEARPSCHSCIKRKTPCEGYSSTYEEAKALLPSRQLRPGQIFNQTSPRVELKLDSGSQDFSDSMSLLCFREFVSLVQGKWISGHSRGNLWQVVMPQLARTDATLRQAAMAVGAMSLMYAQSKDSAACRDSKIEVAPQRVDLYQKHATACYIEALRLQTKRASFRNAVFLSLLLLVFEILRGQRKSAMAHVNHGMAMLLSVLGGGEAEHGIISFAPNPRPVLKDVADIFVHLAEQTRTVLQDRVGHCSPLPNVAQGLKEKNLSMESFIAILRHIVPATNDIGSVPAAFDTVDDFETYWTAFRVRISEIRPFIFQTTYSNGMLDTEDEEVINEKFPTLLGNEHVTAFFQFARSQMKALDAASRPLFTRMMQMDPSSPAYLRALQLRLPFLAAYIFDNPPQYLQIQSMNALSPLVGEFLSLTEMAARTIKLHLTNPAHHFALECELSWDLLRVALFCRDPYLRDKATSLLGQYPGQDGLWDTRSLHCLAQRNLVLEVANACEGSEIEQWQRLWRREYVFENGGERVLFRFLEKDVSGQWSLVEETAQRHPGSDVMQWERSSSMESKRLILSQLGPK